MNKKQQSAADILVKKYKLTYLMVYNYSLHYDGWYTFSEMLTWYFLHDEESDEIMGFHANFLKREYEDYIKKIHINIIKKPFDWSSRVQGTSSAPYFSHNKKFDTTLCRRILDGAF